MNKEDNLLRRFSAGIGESIGLRDNETTSPSYGTGAGARRNFKVDRDIGEIDPSEIFPDPGQPRKEFDEDALEQLAEDIRKRSQLQPIGVRWDQENHRWLIVYGERRWRAIQKAGLDKIKCRFFMDDVESHEIRSIQLVENLQREDLRPVEEAEAYRDLMTANGWKAKEVAGYLHLSPAKVSRALKLLELPDEVKAKIDDGTIAPSTAYQVAKERQPEVREELMGKLLAGELDQKSAKKKSTRTNGSPKPSRRSTNETFLVTHNIRVTVSGRKYVGESGVLEALLEAVERQRTRLRDSDDKKAA